MKVPLSWLRKYVDVHIDLDELAHRLTMAGNEVGYIHRTGYIDNVVVGETLDVAPHPNADRLVLVTVSDGQHQHQVVCGAPNVAAGQKIAFASIGAELIDAYSDTPGKTRKLRKSKIRGVESAGMVCSEKELGIGENHDGILVLPHESPVGAPIGDIIGDAILDIELTPNRPDCLGIVGVARDIAALTGEKLRTPPLEYPSDAPDASALTKVTVQDPDLSPRYIGAVIKDVKIAPSPEWLRQRIESIGERPINNVVDATNFVMFELGQPLHAFDYDKVAQSHVIVRRAIDGETITTLDGTERKLDTEALLIADSTGGIGLAGIIGGQNSEITQDTENIFLESANFNPQNNRRTASQLGVRTEATIRFEKGLRAGLAEVAIRRCLRIISQVAGGTIANGLIDEWHDKNSEQQHVDLTRQRIRKVMGVEYTDQQIEDTLNALGFQLNQTDHGWRVDIPYWRPDVSIPEDLIEEIARIIGYDDMPSTTLAGRVPSADTNQAISLRRRVVDLLISQGMHQTISYTAVPESAEDRVNPPGDLPPPIKIENPVSADHSVLRRTLRSPVLQSAARNTRAWVGPIALFEIGKVFLQKTDSDGLPDEREIIVGALTGNRNSLHWDSQDAEFDFFDAKGIVENLLHELGVQAEFSRLEDATYQLGKSADITASNGSVIGSIGMVAQDVWQRFDPETPSAVMFELDMNALTRAVGGKKRGDSYTPFIRFPHSQRDLALVIDKSIAIGDAIKICQQNRLVKSVTVFDIYQSEQVADGKKSVALRLVYQSQSGTLTSEQVDRAETQIIARLERELGASLRQ